jgi:hypothetical protein
MARRYKDHPALAGYDLMNEPCTRLHYEKYESPGYNWEALNAVMRRAAAAIRQVDDQHLLFIEGDEFATEFDHLDVCLDENLVVSTHNYISPTGGGAPYPGEYDGMTWNRDIIAAAFGMHSGTRRALQFHKPIFCGEFGVWYAGYPAALVHRVAALDDQLGVFDSAGVHWAVWTWKDIASMGTYNLDPHSEYVRTISPVLKARQALADWQDELPQSPATQAFKQAVDAIDDHLVESGLGSRVDRRWFAQFSLFGYLAQFLQVPYANLFENLSETQLDAMLQAFQLKNCILNEPLAAVLQKHLQP